MEANLKQPRLIEGGIHTDHRGQISFVNGMKFDEIVRFYIIKVRSVIIIFVGAFYFQSGKFQVGIRSWVSEIKIIIKVPNVSRGNASH